MRKVWKNWKRACLYACRKSLGNCCALGDKCFKKLKNLNHESLSEFHSHHFRIKDTTAKKCKLEPCKPRTPTFYTNSTKHGWKSNSMAKFRDSCRYTVLICSTCHSTIHSGSWKEDMRHFFTDLVKVAVTYRIRSTKYRNRYVDFELEFCIRLPALRILRQMNKGKGGLEDYRSFGQERCCRVAAIGQEQGCMDQGPLQRRQNKSYRKRRQAEKSLKKRKKKSPAAELVQAQVELEAAEDPMDAVLERAFSEGL